ncbi:SDR family NAD(P)-dependent oxidoreductase [Paramicrobacterium sp. CJ85]|uniref:SDR family NAD(P)-dependent oxidoreductase n=1 Tax=Paramicrobacterium sp. CJ85 TaxID=3445355 RepID=UPI003F5E7D73
MEHPITTIIVGAGEGIGLSVARRFGRSGGKVGLVSRSAPNLVWLAEVLTADGIQVEWADADATRPDELRAALMTLIGRLGGVDVLCFSPLPDVDLIRPVLETSGDDFARALSLSVSGAAEAVAAVAPVMIEQGSGSILFTTGSGALRPTPERAASAVATAAETAYIGILHRELAPRSIRVAHLVIVGAVGPGKKHEPDAVADALWSLHARGAADVVTVMDD